MSLRKFTGWYLRDISNELSDGHSTIFFSSQPFLSNKAYGNVDMRSFLQLFQHKINCFARGHVVWDSMVKEKAMHALTMVKLAKSSQAVKA